MEDTNNILKQIRDSINAQRGEQYVRSLRMSSWMPFVMGLGVGLLIALVISNL